MKKRPLYNEKQKLDFIKQTMTAENTIRRTISIFRAAAPFEEQWSADFSTVPHDDLMPMLEQICGIRMNSKYTYISTIKNYMHWCVEHGVPGAHELDGIDYSENTKKTESSFVRNPEHLQQCLNMVFAPEKDCTQDNVYRCFLWLAYGGMHENTAFSLEASDVSFEYMEASKGDEVAILYRQGIPAIRNCVKLQQFLYRNNAYVNAGEIWRDRVAGTRLLRGIRKDQTLVNFRSQLSRRLRAKKEDGIVVNMLSYNKLWLAGVFYRIYEGEQAGIKPNFIGIAMEAPNITDIKQGAGKIRRDYERWKSVVRSI